MKRWDFTTMMNAGSKLFASIHKRKRYAHANHEAHLMARNISDWLTQRAKQRLMDILRERRLRLSRKKTRIGSIDKGFHFLGINYLEPQPPDGTNVTQVSNDSAIHYDHCLNSMGRGENSLLEVEQTDSAQQRIVPHARTLRNAREQVKQMVNDGISARRIKSYLNRWCLWWVRTSENWHYKEILIWFLMVCKDNKVTQIALQLMQQTIKDENLSQTPVVLDFQAFACDR